MATNEVYKEGAQIPLTVGASVAARAPIAVGQIAGVTLTATGASGTTQATVKTEGVFDLSVKGHDGSSNAEITEGAILYYKSDATPKINVNTAGVRFGYALEGVDSGATKTNPVLLGT